MKKFKANWDDLAVSVVKSAENSSAIVNQSQLTEVIDAELKILSVRIDCLKQVMISRDVIEAMIKRYPAMRHYLIAKQAQEIMDTRLAIAKDSGVNESPYEAISERAAMADRAAAEYLMRIPTAEDPGANQLTQESDALRRKAWRLQESCDDSSFRVRTYTVESERIAQSHLMQAGKLLSASGEETLLNQLTQILESLKG